MLNYYGFKRPRGRRSRNGHEYEKDHLLTVVFEFHGALKPVSTGFVGTSPAFELSLYTLAFLCGQEETLCELGGVATAIHVHRHRGDQDWHLSSRGGRAPGHGRPFAHISGVCRVLVRLGCTGCVGRSGAPIVCRL